MKTLLRLPFQWLMAKLTGAKSRGSVGPRWARLNFAGGRLSSVGSRIGPVSRNSRRKRTRVDGPLGTHWEI